MLLRRIAPLPLLVLLALLWGCADAEELAKQARIAPDASVTVEQALARYPFFTAIHWSSYDGKNGERIVEAVCDIDVAANCREVSRAALTLATRDVGRDYFLARFVVEGFPRRVRALEAQHVTQCQSGQRLALADPKYLRAIYNREPVKLFCLEGLNCPGQGAQPEPDKP